MDYQIIEIDEQTWRIEEAGVRFFLLTGSKKALLVDSGMMIKKAKEIAKTLTNLPIELINTHADRDHIASNYEFDCFYMHPAEGSNYYKTNGGTGTMIPVWDGDLIDLGDRILRVITLPGHTPGSIALLDQTRRTLISGDPIQDGKIFMFGIQREINAYQHSLKKLESYQDMFDQIYPSHGTFPIKPDLIQKLQDGVNKMITGQVEPTEASFHGIALKEYNIKDAIILSDIDYYHKG